MENDILIKYFVEEFVPKMVEQLEKDGKRWGDTWRHRIREGQNDRIRSTYDNYFDKAKNGSDPVDWLWLCVVGNAVIAQCRIDHPEFLFPE